MMVPSAVYISRVDSDPVWGINFNATLVGPDGIPENFGASISIDKRLPSADLAIHHQFQKARRAWKDRTGEDSSKLLDGIELVASALFCEARLNG